MSGMLGPILIKFIHNYSLPCLHEMMTLLGSCFQKSRSQTIFSKNALSSNAILIYSSLSKTIL